MLGGQLGRYELYMKKRYVIQHISFSILRRVLFNDIQLFTDFDKGGDCTVELLAGMSC